ncbi:MAG TPA: YhdP family protein [Gammaproteobacteria bacterium]|nr:YhdP family protein [Gammaproteobacteria bacterium]
MTPAAKQKPQGFGRRLWRWGAALVAAGVLVASLLVGAFRLVAPLVPGYRAEVERWAARTLGLAVSINTLDLRWWWKGPELVLENVAVVDPDDGHVLFRADAIRVGFGVTDVLQLGSVHPGRIVFQHPEAVLERTADHKLLLGGREVVDLRAPAADAWRDVLALLLAHGSIGVRHGKLEWRDAVRGEGPWRFSGIDALLTSDGEDHAFELSLEPPQDAGERLTLRGTASGPPREPESWTWQANVRGVALDAGWLRERLPWPPAAARLDGMLDLGLALDAQGLTLQRVQGHFTLDHIRRVLPGVTIGPVREEAGSPDTVQARFEWRGDAQGWRLAVWDAEARAGARRWPRTASLEVTLHAEPDAAPTLHASADFLRLEDVAALAAWVPPSWLPGVEQLEALAPRGDVRDLVLDLGLAEAGITLEQLVTRFEHLGAARAGTRPGFSGLSGHLHARAGGGELQLAATDVHFDFGPLFRGPLTARRLNGAFSWERAPSGWTIRCDGIRLDNADVADVRARGELHLPADGSAPLIDLRAWFRDARLESKSTYLPVGIMPEALVAWLDHGIVSGRVPEGDFTLQGPLDHFPFAAGGGTFRVAFRVEDAVLDYAAGWPRAEDVTGRVVFDAASFAIDAERARAMGVMASAARGRIADLREGVVEVEAATAARAEEVLAFVRASPLAKRFATYLTEVDATGPADSRLLLHIPLADLAATRVEVETRLAGAEAHLRVLPQPVVDVSGTLRITERGIASAGITGRFLEQPLRAVIATDPGDGTVRIDIAGHSDAPRLAAAFALPAAHWLDGIFDWTLALRVPPQDGRGPLLTLEGATDLRGVAVTLPAPAGKAATEARTTRVALRHDDADRITLDVQYGPDIRAALEFQRATDGTKETWRLAPSEIRLGQQAVTAPVVAGLRITGKVAELDVPAWRAALEAPASGADGASPVTVLPVTLIALEAGVLRGWGQTLDEARLRAERGGQAWHVDLDDDRIDGEITVPDAVSPEQPIVLDMQRLLLVAPDGAAAGAAKETVDPRHLPPLQVAAEEFALGSAHFGRVHARLAREADGVALESFEARHEAFTLSATGDWRVNDTGQRTALSATVTSDDVAAALAALGYAPLVEADEGQFSAEVSWNGGPFGEIVPQLAGAVRLELADGRIGGVQAGAGRALGLFSLSALPRRLLLDFSDVFGRGLAFDRISGDFTLEGGNAYTTNLQLTSPAARIYVVGRTGLAARDYDQIAIVDTSIRSTLPLAGYLVGGVGMGAAVFVLSELFRNPLHKLGRVQYRISGSWEEPLVERLESRPATSGAGNGGSRK